MTQIMIKRGSVVDNIIQDTAQWDYSIEQHENGDVCIRWYNTLISYLADATGLDIELFHQDPSGICYLDIPNEIAQGE